MQTDRIDRIDLTEEGDRTDRWVFDLGDISRADVAEVGGKAANLGELGRIAGVRVPPGFCVGTDAYRRLLAATPSLNDLLNRLAGLDAEDREATGALAQEIRTTIERAALADEAVAAIRSALDRLDPHAAVAVRSSATAEDSAAASFAGQQDTFLNVVGLEAILEHVRRCWASLFTDRAVAYRQHAGIDHRAVDMAVVVHRMVFPDASGVMFTADPGTSNRAIVSIEASYGLGEAVVSGRVNPDVYQVRDGAVASVAVGRKDIAVHAGPGGGTYEQAIEPDRQAGRVLDESQVLQLAELGRRIEAHFGCPQDIEWCLAGDDVWIVQSRPVTSLFPIPDVGDGANHVFLSVGHQQMMTDAMKPLGLSIFQMTAGRPMFDAGGRLFVDVTAMLATPGSRDALLVNMERHDPLMKDALERVLARGDVVPPTPTGEAPPAPPVGGPPTPIATDPALVAAAIAARTASVAALRREIGTKAGEELFEFIRADIEELRRCLFEPQSHQLVMAGIEAAWWLNDRLREWLGEPHASDALAQSVPDNVSSEMGLALLDVADEIRPSPVVVAALRDVGDDDSFLDGLAQLEGGRRAQDAIRGYLDRYGMRCVGEIDITRPRWSERPSALVPLILGHIDQFEPGEAKRRFERGLEAARQKEQEVLARLRALPGGAEKADETKAMIDRLRTFIGYREYPKYFIVSRYLLYKQALLEEADRLVRSGVLRESAEIYYLRFAELEDLVRTHRADDQLIARRRSEHESFRALTPPRVLTSEGEAVVGSYRRDDLPAGALVGLGVSAGTVEGRARVVLDMADADLEPGNILVTAHTDPSWSPLFVTIGGLVTEVGGLMTHGAVVAREYGLPAVVGVENATALIRDGQRIRLDGASGHVELL